MNSFKRILSAVLVMTVMLIGVMTVSTQTVQAASVKAQGETKTVTKVTTKTTSKSVKMKSAAKQSKTTTKITTKKSSKIITDTAEKKVIQNKAVKTTVKTTFTKKSKIKKIKTTVKTTVKTTTTKYPKPESVINESRKLVTPAVLAAFDQLGFEIKINSNLNSSGKFSTEKRVIELKTVESGVLLHEMGHFLDCLKGHAAETDEFAAIYSSEKGKYTGNNKKYVTSTKYEYFAESYRDYIERPAVLKKERPETYAYISKTAAVITQTDIDRMNAEYGLML